MDATPARRPLVAGNWKMHGLKASVSELDRIIASYVAVEWRCGFVRLPR
jgi:hypothetical protein